MYIKRINSSYLNENIRNRGIKDETQSHHRQKNAFSIV